MILLLVIVLRKRIDVFWRISSHYVGVGLDAGVPEDVGEGVTVGVGVDVFPGVGVGVSVEADVGVGVDAAAALN